MVQKNRINSMKLFLAVLITMFLCAGAIGQQSLGDIARQNRNKKKPTSAMTFSDDNMPRRVTPDAEPAKEAASQEQKSGDEAEQGSASKEKTAGSGPAEAEKQ